MALRAIACLVVGLLICDLQGPTPLLAQQADVIAAVKKGTQELAAADKVVAAANNALLAAQSNLDPERFNSATYNVRITSQQLAAAEERYEKASPDQKEDALEALQLAEELAAQRNEVLAAAEKALPERAAEAKAAEEKFAIALKAALEQAAQAKAIVRQAEGDAKASLEHSKEAIEKAAFAKAAAEQGTATSAQIAKAIGAVQAADSALAQAASALKPASSTDRGEKMAQAEAALKAYALAIHAAADHVPALKAEQTRVESLKSSAAIVAAEQARQKAAAALEQSRKDIQDKEKALAEAEGRVKSAQEGVATRTAKLRAQKDLQREQESAKRAAVARQQAVAALPARATEADEAQQRCQAVLEEAVKALLLAPESEPSQSAERESIAKVLTDKLAQLRASDEGLARAAAEAQKAADKAQAALTTANKQLAERAAARDALDQVFKPRFVRQARALVDERRKVEVSLASANRDLQAKTTALNRAAANLKPLKDAAEKAQRDAKAAQGAVEAAAAALTAAQKRAAQTAQAAQDTAKKLAATQAEIDRATADKTSVEKTISQYRQTIDATPAKLATIEAGLYGGLKPLADSEWSYAKARHLLVRAGFGGTSEEVAKLHALGLYGAVRHLVNYKSQPASQVEFAANPKERPETYENSLTGEEQRRIRLARAAADVQQIRDMRAWWLRRMIDSQRPLEEKLTLFWHGHFAAQYTDVGDSHYMFLQNQLFRENAAGNFGALLYGIAHDAAMLKYLNNDTNVKGKANENLAREIMELFGMGRDQGYSETDIRQGARALTGYTYDPWTGQFRFISARHDTEPKKIFGKEGNWSGDDFVQLILETPSAPKFIARQLFVFFAHDDPSPDTVEALANVLRNRNLELEPMLENLFLSEEFYSPKTMGTQIKSPVQLVVGLHRDLGLKDSDLAYLAQASRDMGQELFEPPSVFGWQTGRAWVSTSRTFSRYNALAEILERRQRGGKGGVDVVGTVLAGKKFDSHAAVVDHLIQRCLNVPLAAGKRQALIDFIANLPPPDQWAANPSPANARLTRLLVMLLCSPEYQLS